MKRAGFLVAVLLLVATSCSGGAKQEVIFVDHSSDEFASFFLFNFPKRVEIHPGDTLVVRQTWTGEPHTFTGGTLINKVVGESAVWFDFFDAFGAVESSGAPLPDPEHTGDSTVADFANAVKKAPAGPRKAMVDSLEKLRRAGFKMPDVDHPSTEPGSWGKLVDYINKESEGQSYGVPEAFNEDGSDISQNGGQPCYLDNGTPPKDANKACSKAEQKQPEFNGRQSYYGSGIIRYQGQQGNTFKVPFAKDTKPGTYLFYCQVHGPQQRTEVVVKPTSQKIPGQDVITREAQKEIEVLTEPLEKQWRQAKTKGTFTIQGEKPTTVRGPFAGLLGAEHTAINEFVPKVIHAKAGKRITWKMMGSDHSISFDVPPYFPPVQFLKSGKIRFNPLLDPPAGGAKKVPEQEGMGVVKFDGGTYDGKGFWSSGLIGAEPYLEYTMRISKPGTYRMACLLHPPMVGTVVVT